MIKRSDEGDIMGIGDHGMLAVGKEVAAVAKETVEQMVDDETELISIYYGEGLQKKRQRNWQENWKNSMITVMWK